ncbi:hypothetical protein, partial [Enterobacter hormaechei]|uniref:hypothetical protein n=1 Tax=Enterobacter hormaechei TaxID=158836 RepID=UPI001CC326D5
ETTVKERLLAFIASKDMSARKFEATAGLSNGYVNNLRRSPTAEKMESIFYAFPELSKSWLLTGEGSMLVENSPSEVKKTSSDVENTTSEEEEAIFLPVLNLDARGGLLSNDVVGEEEYIAEQMPFSRNV